MHLCAVGVVALGRSGAALRTTVGKRLANTRRTPARRVLGIGAGLEIAALGMGHRRIAAHLGLAEGTVRGWLRPGGFIHENGVLAQNLGSRRGVSPGQHELGQPAGRLPGQSKFPGTLASCAGIV